MITKTNDPRSGMKLEILAYTTDGGIALGCPVARQTRLVVGNPDFMPVKFPHDSDIHVAHAIVTRWNSHADLVAALELCAKHADFSQCSVDVEAAVDAALSKARA